MLGGIHFLFNRLLRTCLSAVSYGSGKLVCVKHGVCIFGWILNLYTPKTAYDIQSLTLNVFGIKTLHFSLGFEVP